MTEKITAEEVGYRLSLETPDGSRRFALKAGVNVVGSDPACDVCLRGRGVSRRHATITHEGGELRLVDLGSKNGTTINGARALSSRIWPADEIGIGTSRLRLEAVDPEDLELAVTLDSPTAESTESLSSVSQLGFTETASIVALVDARRWLHVIGTVIEILGDGLGPAVEQLRAALGVAGVAFARRRDEDGELSLVAASGEVGTIDQSDTAGETGELTTCRVRSLPGRQLSISPPPGEDAHLLVWGDFEGRAESTEPLTLVARLLALRLSRPGDEPVASEETASELRFPPGIVRGTSAAMEAVYRQLSRLAASALPVLLTGETGVGKEHLAKMVHDASPRRRGPWIAVNCAAVPRELLEAELFGIGKGVATGVAPRPGKFRLADRGTLLLDEIGEMSAELQAKLLRALQDREIQTLGEAPAAVDVRIVAATVRLRAIAPEKRSRAAESAWHGHCSFRRHHRTRMTLARRPPKGRSKTCVETSRPSRFSS